MPERYPTGDSADRWLRRPNKQQSLKRPTLLSRRSFLKLGVASGVATVGSFVGYIATESSAESQVSKEFYRPSDEEEALAEKTIDNKTDGLITLEKANEIVTQNQTYNNKLDQLTSKGWPNRFVYALFASIITDLIAFTGYAFKSADESSN